MPSSQRRRLTEDALRSGTVDPVSELENALGAELLRTRLLRREPPRLADRYSIDEILGRGASGLVVAGTDVRLNRSVALKIRFTDGDDSVLAEARALASLDHPNVVRVYDVSSVLLRLDGFEREAWVVTMPRVEGRTMRAWWQERPRTTTEILGVFVDVGRGLAAAHAARIIHRDVKPENVLVRRDGVAQVLDFGFAVRASPAQSELAGVRAAAGTDPYMAPEARLGRTSRASDQFSLGVTLVEALTGVPRPAGRKVPPGVPREVWRIAQRATAPDPAERFEDLAAMVEAMIAAARPSKRGRAAAMLVVAVAISAGAFALSPRKAAREHASPQPRPGHGDSSVASRPDDAGLARAEPPVAPLLEASTPGVSAAPDSSVVHCEPPTGQYRFRSVEDAPSARQGLYLLGLDARHGRLTDVSLRRLEPMRDQLEVRRAIVRPDCRLELDARAENRDYAFELSIAGRAVSGTFRTSRGANYSGRVVPDGI